MLSGSHPRTALAAIPGRWAGGCLLLSSVLLLLALPRPALAQTPPCSATSVAITGITAVTIDTNTDIEGLVKDCNTLLGLKDALRGTTTLSPDWAVGTAMDTWSETSFTIGGNTRTEPAIIISGTPPRVTELALEGISLAGMVPAGLDDLANLQRLYLNENQLTDSIPPALGNLANLQRLRLDGNELTGPIPSGWGTSTYPLPNLQWLLLNYNPLTGPIPAALADLPSLTLLYLHGTNWTDPIPQALLEKQTAGTLTLRTNRRPVAPTVSDQSLSVEQPFEYPVVFTDPDPEDETLAYHATVAGATPATDTPLPAWLMFDRATGTLSGTLPRGELIGESLMIRVVATDEMNPRPLSASVLVTLNGPPNRPPVGPAVSTVSFPRGTESLIKVPFCDPDGQELEYTATQANGRPLPDWLLLAASLEPPFFLANRGFGATAEDVTVTLTATDPAGGEAMVTFTIAVVDEGDRVLATFDRPNCDAPPPPTPRPPTGGGGGGGTGGTGGTSGGGSGGTGDGGGDADEEDDPAELVGYVDNPAGVHSFQSGLGVLSGWLCEAEAVAIVFETAAGEEDHRFEAAYGTERGDTAPVCGDVDNGFGLLFNWNLLGAGEHTVAVLVDGVEWQRTAVTVTTVGEGAEAEFLEDVAGACVVPDFPTEGQTVRLVWQEANQNFVVAGEAAPAGENRMGVAGASYLDSPAPNSFQSGIGVISGWVCEAETVAIEFETEQGGVHRFEAAYGTERMDTLTPCGDADNGFGLLFNWNLLGDGVHTVVASADGEEFGRAVVRVTTVGAGGEQEFLPDAAGECLVEDFPATGQTTTLEWQESGQNFVVTEVE